MSQADQGCPALQAYPDPPVTSPVFPECLGVSPGMPQGMPGMPPDASRQWAGLPEVYGGTFSVIVSGEREWETLVGGIGEDRYTRPQEDCP